jgi:hypothetical protein
VLPPQEQVVAPFLLRQSNQAQQAHPSNLPSTKSKLQPSLFFWRITQEAKQQQSSSLLSLFCHFSFFHQEQAELLLSIVSVTFLSSTRSKPSFFYPSSPSSIFQWFCSKAASRSCKSQQLQSLTSFSRDRA